ncbi:hypothetical protein RU639_013762 [Aspergillus parasiticus]
MLPVPQGRTIPNSLGYSPGYSRKLMMASISDLQPRKREPLAGTRKPKEQYDYVFRKNAALESEIRTLRYQLAMTKRGQTSSNPALGGWYNTSSGPVLPSSQFIEPLIVNPVSRIPSALSASSQISVASDWHQYGCTRSESICESSDADCLNRVESFMFEDQLEASNPAKVATPHTSFNPPGGHPHEPSFHSYSHLYLGGTPNLVRQEEYQHNPRHAVQCATSQRSMSVPTIPSERKLLRYPVVHAPNNIKKSRNNRQGTITAMTVGAHT